MEWTQALIPIVSSCAMTIAAMPLFIGYFQMKKQGQAIREEGPKWHNSKAGTPTMGGLVFLIGYFDRNLGWSLAKTANSYSFHLAFCISVIRSNRLS